jgi:hypothetical protein
MEGYCILAGILFLFLIGIGSIVCDIIFNTEEEIVFIKKPIQQENFTNFIADNYMDDEDTGLGF